MRKVSRRRASAGRKAGLKMISASMSRTAYGDIQHDASEGSRTNIGVQTYTYNSLGDRVRVEKPTGTRHFFSDACGRVIAEYGASASDVKAEIIWALPPVANDRSLKSSKHPYSRGKHTMRIISGLMLLAGSLVAASQAQAQQCTVPNTLVNGQVADATEVMDNFNAVAACVEAARDDAVTHEGTPNAGEVAVFTSSTGVTGGDLTGDITTSGSTVTTLSDSGVAPGSYANPSIVVDSKGRILSAVSGTGGGGGGGSGGSSYQAPPVDVPVLANFTWLNQDTATAVDGSNGVVITGDIDGQIHGLMQPAPTLASYDVYMRVDQVSGSTGSSSNFYSYPTIILRNSQSDRLLHVFLGRGRSSRDLFWTTGIQRWNGPTSYAGDGIAAHYLTGEAHWLRVNVTSTIATLFISPNGYDWIEVGTENLASYLTATGGTLDEIGFGLRAASVSFSTAIVQQFGTNAP